MPQIIRGPSVVAAGWIPYRSWWKPLPPGFAEYARRRNRKEVWAGLKGLFLTGNAPAPNVWIGAAQIENFLNLRDYRGFLWLSDVELTCDDRGIPTAVDCNFLDDVHVFGFTPVPLLGRYTPRWMRGLTHHAGVGSREYEETLDADGATITLTMRFRVGKVGITGGRVILGYWLPDAWMRVTYRIEATGEYRIALSGSAIPTQEFSMDSGAALHGRIPLPHQGFPTRPRYRHDIESSTRSDVAGFIEAGYAVLAPEGHSYTPP